MVKHAVLLLFITFICMSFHGCTTRAWYQGLQETQRQQCYWLENQAAIQECLDRINSMTFEEYERIRKERLKKNQPQDNQ